MKRINIVELYDLRGLKPRPSKIGGVYIYRKNGKGIIITNISYERFTRIYSSNAELLRHTLIITSESQNSLIAILTVKEHTLLREVVEEDGVFKIYRGGLLIRYIDVRDGRVVHEESRGASLSAEAKQINIAIANAYSCATALAELLGIDRKAYKL